MPRLLLWCSSGVHQGIFFLIQNFPHSSTCNISNHRLMAEIYILIHVQRKKPIDPSVMLYILFLHPPSKFKMYNMTYQSKLLYHLTLPNTRIRETNGLIELLNFPFSFDAHIFGPICHVTVTTKNIRVFCFPPEILC